MAQHEWRLVSYSAVKPPEPQILYSQTSNQAQMENAGEGIHFYWSFLTPFLKTMHDDNYLHIGSKLVSCFFVCSILFLVFCQLDTGWGNQ